MKNMLKFADLKIPSEFAIFMKNGKNKTAFLKDCMITTLIQSLHGAHYCNKLLSNHIDSDMNPVAIFQIYESNIHEKLLV